MARTKPTPAIHDTRPPRTRPAPSFEPADPLGRALNRIKGDGRRQVAAGLAAAGMPLACIPRLLLRENLTAFEHAAFWRSNAFSLLGEWLPDLLPGEIEETRLHWFLPGETRVVSLRARPHLGGAALRLVDDFGARYELPRAWSPCPVTNRDAVALLDACRSEWFPHPLGLFRSAWEEARRRGFGKKEARETTTGCSVVSGRRLRPIVDDLFERFWESAAAEAGDDGEAGSAGPEVVQ